MCLILMWKPTWMGLLPQPPHYILVCPLGGKEYQGQLPTAWLMRGTVTWKRHIHMHIHSILYECELPYMCLTFMLEPTWIGISSATTLCSSLPLQRYPEFRTTYKSLAEESSSNMVRTDTYAHPQHIKVVKHLLWVWHWGGSPHKWLYTLNHHTTLCFAHR